jgi:hypothetical protein
VRLLFEPLEFDIDNATGITTDKSLTSPCIAAIKERHPGVNVTALNDLGMRLDRLKPLGTPEKDRHRMERAAILRDAGTLFAAANVAASRSSFPLMLLKMNPTLRQLHIPTIQNSSAANRAFMLQGWIGSECDVVGARFRVFEHTVPMPEVLSSSGELITSSAGHAEWQRSYDGAGIATEEILNCARPGRDSTRTEKVLTFTRFSARLGANLNQFLFCMSYAERKRYDRVVFPRIGASIEQVSCVRPSY